MRNLAIILSLVIGSAAHAEYKIGDTAIYATSSQGKDFDMKEEVLALDINSDSLTIKESVIFGGATVQESTEVNKISETEQDEQMFDACLQLPSSLNPRYELVNVIAGSFNTCHLTVTDESGAIINAYFAKVLFGVVKMTKEGSNDGSDMTMELKSFIKN